MLSTLMPSTDPSLRLIATTPPTRAPMIPRMIIFRRPSLPPITRLARKPAIAPTTIHATKPIELVPVGEAARGRVALSGRDRIPSEDPGRPDGDQLDDRPADERHDGGDVED